MTANRSEEHSDANLNLEEMYERLFGLVTPKNHYLSERIVELLNQLNARSIDLASVLDELKQLEIKSYDDTQKSVLTSIEEVAIQIDQRTKR